MGTPEHLGRLMQEAPAVALKLMQVSLEQGVPQMRPTPTQDEREPKRLKTD